MTGESPVWLEVELLSDLFVSADGTTTTTYAGVDYLRGSLLFGVAASALFKTLGPDIFLDGRVQFGDGLRLALHDGVAAVPMPQVFHRGGELGPGTCRLFNAIFDGDEEAMRQRGGAAVERLREGDVAWTNDGSNGATPGRGLRWWRSPLELRLKSATDRNAFDRSKDEQLFGYHALPAGLRFAVELRATPDAQEALVAIAKCLAPTDPGSWREVRLGRSKHKEFGRTRVRRMAGPPVGLAALDEHEHAAGARLLVIYLCSDLALFDTETGHPTLVPQALWATSGLPADGIGYRGDLSRLVVRRYSPWNGHLKGRAAERQVLGRGSVLVFEKLKWERNDLFVAHARKLASGGIGLYQAEGLGRIALNPRLIWEAPDRIELQPDFEPTPSSPVAEPKRRPSSLLLEALAVPVGDAAAEKLAADWSQAWAEAGDLLVAAGRPVPSASQWSRLREAAVMARDLAALVKAMREVCEGERHGARVWKQLVPPAEKHSLGAILAESVQAAKRGDKDDEYIALGVSIAAAQMAKAARR